MDYGITISSRQYDQSDDRSLFCVRTGFRVRRGHTPQVVRTAFCAHKTVFMHFMIYQCGFRSCDPSQDIIKGAPVPLLYNTNEEGGKKS